MIAYLRGRLALIGQGYVVLDVQGVGYKVFVSPSVVERLTSFAPGNEDDMLLHTYFHLRQDAMELFGFTDLSEKDMFETLLQVGGIGPRVALSILSSSSVEDLVGAIMKSDERALRKLPGVGPKTAKRMIVELKDTLGKRGRLGAVYRKAMQAQGGSGLSLGKLERDEAAAGGEGGSSIAGDSLQDKVDWAKAALMSLGYSEREVEEAIEKALSLSDQDKEGDRSTESLVRAALRMLAPATRMVSRGSRTAT